MRVAILGAGKMGGILLQAFLKNTLVDAENITATVGHKERAVALSAQYGVQVSTNNVEAAKGADVIVLGVKPWQVASLLAEIKPSLKPGTLLLSIAAGVKISEMEEAAGAKVAVIRAMPNTPAMLTAGMTAFCRGSQVTDAQMKIAERIFQTIGRAVVVEEKHMDAVTGLSGSGPAFFYIIIEAMAEGGVNMGLPRDVATLLASQTMFGSARMVLETGYHPAMLKDAVTTPAGSTVDGILALEEGGLRAALIQAVRKATLRAKELAKG
jgi:pyrroline-5-carboxylate reductase